MPSADLDTKVKLAIYEITSESGRVPNSSEISRKIDIDKSEVLGAFGRLHAKRLIVWDAYGIAAALRSDAISQTSDGYTGEPLTLEIKNGQPVLKPYVAHFAVPAAHWWDDLVFT